MKLSDSKWTLEEVRRWYYESAERYQTPQVAYATRRLRKLLEYMESAEIKIKRSD